jgi:hypothetical protein
MNTSKFDRLKNLIEEKDSLENSIELLNSMLKQKAEYNEYDYFISGSLQFMQGRGFFNVTFERFVGNKNLVRLLIVELDEQLDCVLIQIKDIKKEIDELFDSLI